MNGKNQQYPQPARIRDQVIGLAARTRVIFLLNGASGSGKSAGVRILNECGIPVLRKYTDRPARSSETLSDPGAPLCLSPQAFSALAAGQEFYQWTYGGYRYGFCGAAVRTLLSECGAAAMVLGSQPVMAELCAGLVGFASVIRVFVHVDDDLILRRLRAAGRSQEEIATRMARSHEIRTAFNATTYDAIIENNADLAHLHARITHVAAIHVPGIVIPVAA